MYRLKQLILILGDILSLYFGLYAAVLIRQKNTYGENLNILLTEMSALFLFSILIIFITGLYDIEKIKNNKKNLSRIAISASIWFVFGVFYFYAADKSRVSPKTILLLNAIIGFLIMTGWRTIYNRFISQSILKTKIAFAGSNKEINELIKYLENKPQLGYKIIGFIIPNSDKQNYGLPTANNI